MPKMQGPCPHGWALPGDAWVVEKILAGGQKRVQRCRLCKQNRMQTYGKDKRWHTIEQLAFTLPVERTPEWAEEMQFPILGKDWDWET